MKKILKRSLLVIVLLLLVFAIAIVAMQFRKFDAPYPKISASTDTSLINRGRYLVYGPAHCADCHASPANEKDINEGKEVLLQGGRSFVLPIGTISPPNLTSDKATGIGAWRDEEIARSLRYGVGHDGRAIFNFMPFHNLSDRDLTSIISFLRTMPPVSNKVTIRKLNVMGYIINALLLRPVGPDGTPPANMLPDSTAAYGEYLANNIANCRGCHTDRNLKTGEFTGPMFAGGFHLPSRIDPEHFECVTPNLTPDPKTGHIFGWSEELFLQRFRKGKIIPHSEMPWGPFKRISDLELKALYAYLHTLAPVERNNYPVLRQLEN